MNNTTSPWYSDQALVSFFLTYLENLASSSTCAIMFTFFLSLNAWKAFKRRAHWIAGQLMVLNALTIQIFYLIVHFNPNVKSKDIYVRNVQIQLLMEDQVLTDCRRVMICVFITYLILGMVHHANIGALILSVIY